LLNKLSVILVAEDDEANFRYIKAVLDHSTKAEIIHAVSGREAIEKFTNNHGIDLVLMDMKMPEINGIDATKMIKSMNHDVPVIAMTAYAMQGDETRIMEAGCDGYLSKPINKKDLIDKIKEFVRL
jgi:CheY-like chemotaxis protein